MSITTLQNRWRLFFAILFAKKLLSVEWFCWPMKLSSNRTISSAPQRQSAFRPATFSRIAIRKRNIHISLILALYIYRYLHLTPARQIPRNSTPHKLLSFFVFFFVIIAQKITRISGNFRALLDRKCIHQKNLIRNLALTGVSRYSLYLMYVSYYISYSFAICMLCDREQAKRANWN